MISVDHVSLATNTLVLKLIHALVESGHITPERALAIFDSAIADHEAMGTDANSIAASFLRQLRESETPE